MNTHKNLFVTSLARGRLGRGYLRNAKPAFSNLIKIIPVLILVVVFSLTPQSVFAQSTPSFTFGAAGDYANGSNFQATATQVKAANPDFQIALGDFAYSTVE